MGNRQEQTTKIVFLDIDGVLNNADSDMSVFFVIEVALMRILKRIIDETGASIVLTSTWRYTEATRTTVKHFFKKGEIPQFISCTRRFDASRVDEIICWLQDNTDFEINVSLGSRVSRAPRDLPVSEYTLTERMHVTHWVVIDDMNLMKKGSNTSHLKDRFVRVNKKDGLTEGDADHIIRILNAV